MTNKELYEKYKKQNICVACHTRKPEKNRVKCTRCLNYDKEYKKRIYEIKTSYKTCRMYIPTDKKKGLCVTDCSETKCLKNKRGIK